MDKSINNAALYDTFSAFGRILSCKVEVDNKGVPKGYGFVAYETQEEADKAVARVNGMMIADKIVYVFSMLLYYTTKLTSIFQICWPFPP